LNDTPIIGGVNFIVIEWADRKASIERAAQVEIATGARMRRQPGVGIEQAKAPQLEIWITEIAVEPDISSTGRAQVQAGLNRATDHH
jgi:hypothetical protein